MNELTRKVDTQVFHLLLCLSSRQHKRCDSTRGDTGSDTSGCTSGRTEGSGSTRFRRWHSPDKTESCWTALCSFPCLFVVVVVAVVVVVVVEKSVGRFRRSEIRSWQLRTSRWVPSVETLTSCESASILIKKILKKENCKKKKLMRKVAFNETKKSIIN